VQAVLAVALLVLAVAVRGCEHGAPARPQPAPGDLDELPEPLQLLGAAGAGRMAELDAVVASAQRAAWVDTRAALDRLEGCPKLLKWIARPEGQRLERLLTALETGSRQEALGALALIFRVAGRTEWEPGMFGGAAGAERLGGLLQDWLEVWAAKGVDDPLLYEPTLAAVLLYGRVMNAAFESGLFGDSERSLERARACLARLCTTPGGLRTPLAIALEDRYPGALDLALEDEGILEGLADEAALLFPDHDGECGE